MYQIAGFIIVAVMALASCAPQALSPAGGTRESRSPTTLRGTWKATETLVRTPGTDWVKVTPPSSLYIFTDDHYSYMFVTGPQPRPRFAGDPNRPTNAEKIAAFDSFMASSGRYSLSGSTLTLTPLLHRNPHEMAGGSLTYTVKFGPGTVEIAIVNPPFAPGSERRTVLTRIE